MNKINILYLLVSVTCYNLLAGEFFFINTIGTPSLENIMNNIPSSEIINTAKTYHVESNNYTILTTTNESVVFKFSNDTIFRMDENTKLQISSFDQDVDNIKAEFPEKIKYNNSILNAALISGQIELINDVMTTTNSSYISTSHVNIVPMGGKFVIKTDNNSTMIICIDGKAQIFDRNNRKKKTILDKNNTLIIIPQPSFNHAAEALTIRQNIFTQSTTEEPEYTNCLSSLNSLYTDHNKVIFITCNGKIYGLRK